MGFQNHKIVLDTFKKKYCSNLFSLGRPYGRTSLEAASRGCAVIISNRGGLSKNNNEYNNSS